MVKDNGYIFIMYMIKLKDLLVEAQTFNFNKSKNQIMRLIKKIRDGESLYDHDNPFYTISPPTHSQFVNVSQRLICV